MELIFCLILITLFLIYVQFFAPSSESFNANSESSCEFIPWGPSKRACVDRCRVDRALWGGEACSSSSCYSICNMCVDNSKCKWLNSRDMLEEARQKLQNPQPEMDIKIDIRGIPSDKSVIINFIHDDRVDNYLLKYFESANPGSGVTIFKIKEPKKGFNTITIINLKNDVTYSFVIVPMIDSKIQNMREKVDVTPSGRINISI